MSGTELMARHLLDSLKAALTRGYDGGSIESRTGHRLDCTSCA